MVVNWDYANGQLMVATGKQIKDLNCISEVCDFYYGLVTKDSTPEQRAELDNILSGNREGVATSQEVELLDEFEAMLAEMRAEKEQQDG